MHEDGSLDWQSYRALVDWHIDSGTNGIVVMGSTGESATVSMQEHADLIGAAVDHAMDGCRSSRAPVRIPQPKLLS
jgi:4-hydroxy-tetrahydrodipicolinate synthase